jgi:hypothetical protein
MEQSPSCEANTRSTNQEVPHFLWNQKVYYRVEQSLRLDPILSQFNSVQVSITID